MKFYHITFIFLTIKQYFFNSFLFPLNKRTPKSLSNRNFDAIHLNDCLVENWKRCSRIGRQTIANVANFNLNVTKSVDLSKLCIDILSRIVLGWCIDFHLLALKHPWNGITEKSIFHGNECVCFSNESILHEACKICNCFGKLIKILRNFCLGLENIIQIIWFCHLHGFMIKITVWLSSFKRNPNFCIYRKCWKL